MTAIAASSRCIPTWCWAWSMPLFEEILDDEKDDKGVELDTDLDADDLKRIAGLLQGAGRKRNWASRSPKTCRNSSGAPSARCSAPGNRPRANTYRRLQQYSRGLGHRRHGAGDGVRQSRRDIGHRRRLHPRSRHRRKAALWRIPDQRPGRRRGGRHPHAAADLQDRARAPGRQESRRWKRRCPRPSPN